MTASSTSYREGIDVALRLGTLADSTAIARKIASGGGPWSRPPPTWPELERRKSPADLAHHHAVVYSQLGDTWTFRQGETEMSVAVRGRLRVSAAEGIARRGACRHGVGGDVGLDVRP